MKVNYHDVLIGVGWYLIGHGLTFLQLQGQFFKTDWFRKNEIIVAGFGVLISLFYIWGTKSVVQGFNGLLWPPRFIGFAVGIVIYAFGVSYFFKQGINLKTLVSLILCLILISIQVLWKTK